MNDLYRAHFYESLGMAATGTRVRCGACGQITTLRRRNCGVDERAEYINLTRCCDEDEYTVLSGTVHADE